MKGWHQDLIDLEYSPQENMFWWSNKGGRWRELLSIQVLESANEAGWESNEGSSNERRKKWVKKRGTHVQADSQTHTQTQAKVTQPAAPPNTQSDWW